MKATPIDCEIVKEFESKYSRSVTIDNHGLDKCCPISEGNCFKIILENTDINRIFLLFEPTFTNITSKQNYMLVDVIDSARKIPRVEYWLNRKIDLSISIDCDPVFVSPRLEGGSLIAVDGNHRLIAHFLIHRSIQGLQAYLLTHPNISQWTYFPPQAK